MESLVNFAWIYSAWKSEFLRSNKKKTYTEATRHKRTAHEENERKLEFFSNLVDSLEIPKTSPYTIPL